MKPLEIVACDGCGNRITAPERAWEYEGKVLGRVVQVHPNSRCAREAEHKLGVSLR
jgi:hypothetical protein